MAKKFKSKKKSSKTHEDRSERGSHRERKTYSKKKGKSEFVRLTALFESRNGGRVGSVRDEYLDNLGELVEKAQESGKGVAFFLKRWNKNENPVLSATIAQEYRGKKKSRYRDDEDEDEDEGGEEEGSDDYDL